MGEASVAIVVPIFRRELTTAETWALNRARGLLAAYDQIALAPADLVLDCSWSAVARFDPANFRSRGSYSRLLLTPAFYSEFLQYEWILILQLDVLLLRRDIGAFVAGPWDYIGAPWLEDPTNPERGFSRVGNGGLSLRRVSAFRSVLMKRGRPRASALLGLLFRGFGAPDIHPLSFRRRVRLFREIGQGALPYLSCYSLNEDRFWSDRARLFDQSFRVAQVADGLHFAFEQAPRLAFSLSGQKIPIGIHAWQTYDEEFCLSLLASASLAPKAVAEKDQ